MKLDHINLTVDDVAGARELLEKHFGMRAPIGFIQATNEDVDEINRRVREDGYDVEAPSRQHGAWTFYFEAPGGFTVEVLC
jgi:lactoylglutathione lyase